MQPGMNFNHSKMAYWFERSRSVLDSTNYLIVSLSPEYRGLFASCGGWGEGKMEARGERWEGETSRLFPLPIVHLALSIFKSLPFLMDTQREPLQRSELQYSFCYFFFWQKQIKNIAYLLISWFFLFLKHMLLRYFSQLKSLKDISLRGSRKKGEGEGRGWGRKARTAPLSSLPNPPPFCHCCAS